MPTSRHITSHHLGSKKQHPTSREPAGRRQHALGRPPGSRSLWEESRPATAFPPRREWGSGSGQGGRALQGWQLSELSSVMGASRSLVASPAEILAARGLGLPCFPEAQLQAGVGSCQEHPSSSFASLSYNFYGCKSATQRIQGEKKNVDTLSLCKWGMLSSGKIHNHKKTHPDENLR